MFVVNVLPSIEYSIVPVFVVPISINSCSTPVYERVFPAGVFSTILSALFIIAFNVNTSLSLWLLSPITL